MSQLFKRLHSEGIPQESAVPAKAFQALGIEAFKNTFRALFAQANVQAARLSKFNTVIALLEDALFNLSTIDELTAGEKLVLFESVVDQAATLTSSLVILSKPLANVRLIIATLDGLEAHQAVNELKVLKDANSVQALSSI